ncbi:MAG: hypothetical protein O7D91_11475 [Planctomycetota bacterium]|nr:hypothetical protein [Planctomycetota bacterium]
MSTGGINSPAMTNLASISPVRIELWKSRGNIVKAEREWVRLQREPPRLPLTLLRRVYGICFGFGHRLRRGIALLLVPWILGWGLLACAHQHGAMVATKEQTAVQPRFEAAMYSIDTLIPVFDLKVESDWIVDFEKGLWGFAAWWYLRLHILAGWVLLGMGVLDFSHLISRR